MPGARNGGTGDRGQGEQRVPSLEGLMAWREESQQSVAALENGYTVRGRAQGQSSKRDGRRGPGGRKGIPGEGWKN